MRIHQLIKGGVIACWLSLLALGSWAQSAISIPFQSTFYNGPSFQAQTQIGVPFAFTDSGNGRYFQAFFPDSVWLLTDSNYAAHEIRYIPEQEGIAGNAFIAFYVKCDSLPLQAGQPDPWFSMTLLPNPVGRSFGGRVSFNPRTRFFQIYSLNTDSLAMVRFTCIRGTDTVQQVVSFLFSRPISEEENAFGLGSAQVLPNVTDREYTIISPEANVGSGPVFFNGQNRVIKDLTVSAIELVVDGNNSNYLSSLNGRADIRSLTIHADRLVVRRQWDLPGTNLTIYCNEIRFEDSTNNGAFINTIPLSALPSNGAAGQLGQKAGNITLHAKTFSETGSRFRFLLTGGKGQDAVGAVSGGGGSGGDFISNLNLFAKVDNLGGVAGTSVNGTVGLPNRGSSGLIQEVDSLRDMYLHPFYLKQLLSYWGDAFYLGKQLDIEPKLNLYLHEAKAITAKPEFQNYPAAFSGDLSQFVMEAEALSSRITSRLDFFGNPVGWVPMLTFEVTKQAFDAELNHSIRMMYLNYFLKKSAGVLQGQVAGLNALSARLQTQATIDQANFTDLVTVKLPAMGIKIEESKRKMENLQKELERVIADVERRQREAQERAKRRAKWIGIAKTVGTITSFLPIPGAQIIGPAITAGATAYEKLSNQGNLRFNLSSAITVGGALADGFAQYKGLNQSALESKIKMGPLNTAIGNFFPTFNGGLGINNLKTIAGAGQNVVSEANSIIKKVQGAYKDGMSATKEAIQKAQSNQFAQAPEILVAQQALQDARLEHENMVREYTAYNDQSLRLSAEIAANALAYDHARTSATSANQVIDHRAVQYIDQLTKGCINRLRKYHYFMAKAYEYRTLQPYTGNLNIQSIINSAQAMVDSANVLDSTKSQMTQDQFTALAALYEDQVRQIANNVYTFYLSNPPTQTISAQYNLPVEDLERINRGDTIVFNPLKKGLFPTNEENLRINSIRVSQVTLKAPTGTIGSPAQLDINFEYPNESRVRTAGKIYYFNNYNLNTQTPISWRTRYNVSNNSLVDFKPSVSTTSFLSSLLTNSINNSVPSVNQLSIYSQPLADADMLLSIKSFNNNGTEEFKLQTCTITIEYDFNQKPAAMAYLDIRALPEWIVPEYRVSQADNFQKQDGQGEIARTYTVSNSRQVRVSPQARIGKFRFERWLNNNGSRDLSADSTNLNRQFTMSQNRAFVAQYKYAGPVMKVPDTILVRFLNQPVSVTVQNVGEDQGMEWFVDSSSTGISLATSVPKGIDQGSFNFSVTDTSRLKYIFFASPDALNGFDTTVVLFRKPDAVVDTVRQSFCFGGSINIPGIGVVSQAGSYRDTLPGDTIIKLYVVTVNPLPNPVLSNAQPQVICAGNSSTLNIVSPQPDWQINWFKNGMLVGNGPQIALGGLNASNDWYRARVTNVNGCQQFTDSVNIQIRNFVTPQVNIVSNQPQNTLCSGSSITFTAQPTDPGTAPVYQWLLNGNPIASATGASFSSSSLTNNALVSVRMTANNQCQNVNQVTSQAISVTVNAPVVPAVSISSTNVSACQGDSVFIQSIGVNMGSNPRYSWSINQQLVDTSNALRTTSIQNGDTVRVLVRTNAVCQTVDSVWSNALIFNITPKVNPSVSFALPTNAICAATGFTFIATPVNGGPSPVYQWRVNGQVVGGNSNSFFYNNPVNGDLITVSMTANNVCQNYALASGNLYAVTSIPAVVPALSISNLPSAPLCNARPFIFQTTTVNGGPSPQYQWLINGQPVLGANGATFNYTTPQNGQVVSVQLTPNNACQTTNQVNVSYNVQALSAVTPSVTTNASSTNFCEGAQETITAFPQQGGIAPVYEWRVNGVVQTGQNTATFTMNGLLSGSSSVLVRMIANNSCQTLDTAMASPISVVVNPIPSKPVINRVGQVLTSSAPSGNQWYRNGQLISGANGVSLTPITFGSYTVTTTVNGCTSPQSDTILFIPTGIVEGGISNWRYYPNPVSEQVNISLEISEPKHLQIQLIDLQGRVVKWVDLGVVNSGLFTSQFSVDDVSNGLYMIRISSDDEFKLGKLQVTR